MNNKEFIAAIAEQTGKTQKEATEILDQWVNELKNDVVEKQVAQIDGVGYLETRMREQRTIVNPGSKQRMLIPPKMVVAFKPIHRVKNEIN
ncbi:MAG: HU family DNA-binding protein [Paludibacteraceae bacterium]|nr:HU family DNA-binding protein [Paludibacteraceae bacterium]